MVRIKRREDIVLSSQIKTFLDAEKIYIPVKETYEILIKTNSKVKMFEPIMKKENILITSPVSGVVMGIENKKVLCELKPFIVIKNDFKEEKYPKCGIKKEPSEISINDFKEMLDKHNIIIDGELLSTKIKGVRTIIVNTIEDDPYVSDQKYLMDNYLIEILDTIDYIAHILKIKNIHFLVNNKYTETINELFDKVGTYPNIKVSLITNDYPFMLDKYLKNIDCKNELIINARCINDLYHAFYRNCENPTHHFILAGNAIKNSVVYNVKNGTSFESVINNKSEYHDCEFLINSLMLGEKLDIQDVIITKDIKAIFIMKKETSEVFDCISCGECVASCPVKLNPKYVMDYPTKKISNTQRKKCIQCNLCTYVCPAKINLMNHMKVVKKDE